MPLTDIKCRNAVCPPDKARVRLADSGGLYLEISPNKSKRWFWKYLFDGKEKRIALANKNARILWAVLTRGQAFDANHLSVKPTAA